MTPRLYCPGRLDVGAEVGLPEAAAHHALRVLRLKVGGAVTLFDGDGGEYIAHIESASSQVVVARIDAANAIDRESPLDVTVVHGLASADRMDYAVQKAVELGARAIVPVATLRSVVQLDERRAAKRVDHWRSIAIAACEQCGRNRLPVIGPVQALGAWLAVPSTASLRFLLAADARESLASIAPPVGAIELLVGAEGGFTLEESTSAVAAGFRPVRMGPRVLRTETAAAAALAAMNALWGDWR